MNLEKASVLRDRTVRASRCAAVGVVTEGVDVHATLGVGVVARDVPRDSGRGRLGRLLEGDGAGDLGVTPDDSDCTHHVSNCPSRGPAQLPPRASDDAGSSRLW